MVLRCCIPIFGSGSARAKRFDEACNCREVRHEAHFVEPIFAVDGEPTEISGHPRLGQKYVAIAILSYITTSSNTRVAGLFFDMG